MAIERWRPLGALMERNPFRDIQNELNRLFDNFLGRPTTGMSGTSGRVWMPVGDIHETNDDLILNFELPGAGDVLTVKGERPFGHQVNGDNYVHTERVYGRFERSIRLPVPVQAGRVRARYRDGVLEVSLPKAEEVRPKEIRIDVS